MSFAHPAWLISLALLPLLGVATVVVARLRRKQWHAFMAPRLRESILKRSSPLNRWLALALLLLACGTLAFALARPQAKAGTRTEKTLGRNVLIALDLSRSMRVRDVKPDRLSQAKIAIYELLEAMPNERIGLIGFAGSAYVYAPLTVDHAAVRETVEQIDENWATEGGSNLTAAVGLGIETLKKTGQKHNALVILSDGEEHNGNLNDMIAEAERAGVYILAVGVGTEDGDYVPNPNTPRNRAVDRLGRPIISQLRPDVLRELAAKTGGRFSIAGSGADIPAMVKSAIKDMDAFEVEGREREVAIEFYQWFALPAVVLLMASILAGTRWRGIHAVVLATGIFLLPSEARADAVADARKALEKEHYPQAREAYHELAEKALTKERKARFRLGEGTAAYHGGDFRNARSAYSATLLTNDPELLANGHIGLGNTLFQLGWRTLSSQPYPDDPSKVPSMADFDNMVRLRLKKLGHDTEDSGSSESKAIESLITNWADAVRHFDSAIEADRSGKQAQANKATTMTYLKRLQELIEAEKQQTQQSMPAPQPGSDDSKQKGGKDDKKQPGEDGDDDKKRSRSGDHGDEEKEDAGGDENNPEDKSGQKPDDQKDKKDASKEGAKPDETPEERARRILKENADLEKGPLSPGRRIFRNPKKDW